MFKERTRGSTIIIMDSIQRRNQSHQKEHPIPRMIGKRRVTRSGVPIAREDSI